MIGAGRRNKLITIQTIPESISATGEVVENDPVTVCKVMAAIEPLSAREAWQALESQATTSHKITIPYVGGITSRMQAVYNSRTFHFDGVVNSDENNRELVILATEIVT